MLNAEAQLTRSEGAIFVVSPGWSARVASLKTLGAVPPRAVR
jgi:hypothetical protein